MKLHGKRVSEIYSTVDAQYPKLWEAQGGMCFYCTRPMKLWIGKSTRHSRMYLGTKDHFIPRAYGAKLKGNVVLACASCNSRANHTLPSPEELERFIALYQQAGRDPSYVVESMQALMLDESALLNISSQKETEA